MIDATYKCRKKKMKSGFYGAPTPGHKACVIGLVELSSALPGRVTTGRVKLILAGGKNAEKMKQVFAEIIHEGTEVWHDGHSAFSWLDHDDRREHDSNVHAKQIFSK